MELNRVFTVEEFARHLGGQKSLAEYRVRYYLRQGRLKRLANGVYATVPVGADPESFEPDAFLAAAAIRPDAVFAYHSALDLLGQGHSVWWTCTVCTARRRIARRPGAKHDQVPLAPTGRAAPSPGAVVAREGQGTLDDRGLSWGQDPAGHDARADSRGRVPRTEPGRRPR